MNDPFKLAHLFTCLDSKSINCMRTAWDDYSSVFKEFECISLVNEPEEKEADSLSYSHQITPLDYYVKNSEGNHKESEENFEDTTVDQNQDESFSQVLEDSKDSHSQNIDCISQANSSIYEDDDSLQNFDQKILAVCINKMNQQNKVDEGTYKRKGPGRRRQNPLKTSLQLKNLVKIFLRQKISKILSNKKCKDRKDAVITFLIRAVKKVTYYLVEIAAAKNMYKRRNPSEYLISFVESFIAFISMSSIKSSGTSLVKQFLEFIIIYFPSDKCSRLLKI